MNHTTALPMPLRSALPVLEALPAPSMLVDFLYRWRAGLGCEDTPQDCAHRHQLSDWLKNQSKLHAATPQTPEQWEHLRRMLLSMLSSPWVLLSALAAQLAQLRDFRQLSLSEQQQLATLTQRVYAPICNRLGLSAWKWEMEDIAFRLSDPQCYADIARALAAKRTEREDFIAVMQQQLEQLLSREQISADVSGRPKHLFSIHKKMQRKGLTFDQLYDLHALRILTDSVESCYRILALLHQHYLPLLSEYDDYIAKPKANGYQSIHTILIGPRGWAVEVQIRTRQMHLQAEQGVAAHWRYKEGSAQDQALERLVGSLRSALTGELDEVGFCAWEKELLGRHVYALTPKGDIIRLIQGATLLDFAYAIHTDVGHACRGARVNGRIQPLDTPVSNGDRVEILTQKNGTPSRNWLNERFLVTARARNKVRNFFNRQHADTHLMAGRALLDKLRARFRLGSDFTSFAVQRLRQGTEKALATHIGQGQINSRQLSALVQDYLNPPLPASLITGESPVNRPARTDSTAAGQGQVYLPGIGRVSAQMAHCCQPLPPEPIIGLLTRTQGLRIHRQTCPNLLTLPQASQQRLLRVRWGQDTRAETELCLEILVLERDNLLADLVHCLTEAGARIGHFHTRAGKEPHQLHIHLQLTLPVQTDWLALTDRLGSVEQVLDVVCCIED